MRCCRGCKCAGCKATCIQAIRLSYFHASRLFSILERKRVRGNTYKLVGASLARVLHTHICYLLESHTQQSVQHCSVLQAQLCLQVSLLCLLYHLCDPHKCLVRKLPSDVWCLQCMHQRTCKCLPFPDQLSRLYSRITWECALVATRTSVCIATLQFSPSKPLP